MDRAFALAAIAFALCFAVAVGGVWRLARSELERASARAEGEGARDGVLVRRDARLLDGGGVRRRRRGGAPAERGDGAEDAEGAFVEDEAPVRTMSRKEQRLEMYRQRWEAREAAEREEMELAARSGGSRRARAEDAEDAEDAEPEVSDETLVAALEANRISTFDQLAKRFGFKKLEAIRARVQKIEAAGLVSGVVDASRFVRVSRDELESIASFVLERGRVDIEELTEKSNRVLALS